MSMIVTLFAPPGASLRSRDGSFSQLKERIPHLSTGRRAEKYNCGGFSCSNGGSGGIGLLELYEIVKDLEVQGPNNLEEPQQK